jgi:TP901 family phage tail tape measure protein
MADLMQRGKFAFGMKSSDLLAAASYEAPVLNQLGLSGLENANKMMAIQGMSAQVGLEGSSFGTNFAQMLSRLAKGPEMMEMASKGMKGKAQEIVEGMGITFDFFDEDRNFKGLDSMIQELEKLKLIADKAGQESALIVADALFGAEAGRPAMILAEQGLEGFKAAQERMAQQADLQQRIERITQSTANTFEALGGSMENLGAALAGPAVKSLHPLINLLNDATGAITTFAEANPVAVKWLGSLVGGVLAVTAAFMGFGVLMNFGRYALTGLQLIPGLGTGLSWLAGILKGALLGGLKMSTQAILALGRALLMNPVGLLITGIALSAYLIYRYWEPIKGFFEGVWNRIKTAFDGGIQEVGRLVLDWSPLGLFYRAFSGVLSWFGVDIPKQFSEFGANMISGLVSGLTSRFAEAKESVMSLGQGARDWFKEKLGINSPSTVFLGLGGNIGEGAALGILRSVPGVQEASNRLASAALAGAIATTGAGVDLPGPFPKFGANMINGLISGIGSGFAQARESVTALGQGARDWFKEKLGINSPGTVFPELGGNIGEDATPGILRSMSGVREASNRLASAALAGAIATTGASGGMALDPQSIRAANQALSVAQVETASQGTGGSGMTLHFAPVIHVNAGGNDARSQVQEAMQLSLRDLEQMLRRIETERERRSY